MDDKIKLNKEEIRVLIENELYALVETAIEGEYNIDRLDNLVYKDGGRKRAITKIKELLTKWEETYNYPKSDIINVLKISLQGICVTCKAESKEISTILDEITEEEKVKKDIEEGNIEKYERNI